MLRLGMFALALSLGLAGRPTSVFAHGDGEDDAEGTPGAAAAGETSAKPVKRKGPERLDRRRKSRVVGYAVPDGQLRSAPLPAPSGHIELHTLAGNEEAEVDIFNDDGSYDIDAIHELDHLLRCKRTDTEKSIDPRLYVLLSHVYDHFQKRIDLVSGYRNQRRETSFHFKGSASDIRIEGVSPKKIRQFAETLDAGGMGIGLYPRARFVHIDVRPLPSYRWIDNARPNPNSPDKRPPRGWKRKKLQS
jgi:uncharacterized protein YcbK (DUF882 family)